MNSWLKWLFAAGLLLTASAAPAALRHGSRPSPANPGPLALRTKDLVAALGVNTHIYQGGNYSTSSIISDMAYLGIKHIRDYPLQYFGQTLNYNTLAGAGLDFEFVMAGEGCTTDRVSAGLMPGWVAFQSGFPNGLLAVEGPNEINNQPVTYCQNAPTNNSTAPANATLHFASASPSYSPGAISVATGGYGAGMTVSDTSAPTTPVVLDAGSGHASAGGTISLSPVITIHNASEVLIAFVEFERRPRHHGHRYARADLGEARRDAHHRAVGRVRRGGVVGRGTDGRQLPAD